MFATGDLSCYQWSWPENGVSPDTSKEQAEQLVLNLGEQPDVFEWHTVNAANQGSNLILPVTQE